MAGTLSDTLTNAQLLYLSQNQDKWYGVKDTTVTKYSTWDYIVILSPLPGTDERVYEFIINADGSDSISAQYVTSGFWKELYENTNSSQVTYYKNWGDDKVDSYTTIGIPSIPVGRFDYTKLIRIKDTDWTWANLANVLRYMNDVHAIPESIEAQQNLAFEWDSLMANRLLSPYMNAWVLNKIDEKNIAVYLSNTFKEKWNRIYDLMVEEYDPIANYSISEVEHIDIVKDEESSQSGSSSFDSSGGNSSEGSASSLNQRYGFNSSNAVNSYADEGDKSASSEYTDSSSAEDSKSGTFDADNDTDRTLTRTGKIGNITVQDMAEKEWKLREHLLLETIRKDITDVLTLPIYSTEEVY